jgi:meso-butanediol dehydrogenase/(S,S)-butanediol dehydrogenase/diacetyl reductase
MGRLEGRVAIVTGGGRGIGEGICTVLAREGAQVAVTDVNAENASAVAEALRATGAKAEPFELDVTDAAEAERLMGEVTRSFGRVDILVNNAGVLGHHVFSEVTLEDWELTYRVNLLGIWIMSRAVVPHFRANGGGKIVNIASIAGRRGGGLHPHYSASKAGAISITQSLAADLGRHNINVNAVCPGLIRTNMWQSLESMVGQARGLEGPAAMFDQYIATNCPLRREQTPEDIGMAVAFFASDDAKNITGQALNVDGGLTMN